MRVIRRTRPSQVGCGSSVARRRLLHASGTFDTREVPLPSLMLLVRLNAQGTPLTRLVPPVRDEDDRDETQTAVLVGSSAGRR